MEDPIRIQGGVDSGHRAPGPQAPSYQTISLPDEVKTKVGLYEWLSTKYDPNTTEFNEAFERLGQSLPLR